MITTMFFGDIIIKEYYSAGEVHVRGVNNETEQGAIKYIFACLFVFCAWRLVYKVGGMLFKKKKKKVRIVKCTNQSICSDWEPCRPGKP